MEKFSSVQFSHSVVSNSFWPHGLQHARLPCPLPTPRSCSNSCPLSWWCHPTISSLSLPSPAFNLTQLQGLFQWVSSLHQVAKVLKLHLQHQFFQWIFRIDFLYYWLIWSLCCPKDSQESSPAPEFESVNSSVLSLLYGPTLTCVHDYWKNHSFDYTNLWWQLMSLLFNSLSRSVIAFLPRSKCLLITWLQSPSAVILEPKKIKSVSVALFSPPICHEVIGSDSMIFVFWILSFKPAFSLSSFTFIKRFFSFSLLYAFKVVLSA